MNGRLSILLLAVILRFQAVAAEAPLPVQMPPIPPSPIEDFRRLLKLTPAERDQALAEYPPANQEVLRRKLEAYAAMRSDQRDYRLRLLELRWHLLPLMNLAPTERGNYLQMIPVRLHDVVTTRLQQWDGLNPETRREILADQKKRELATSYFVHVRRSGTNSAVALQPGNPPHPNEVEEELKRWQSATPAHRQKMTAYLATFFDLGKADQEKALDQLAETERQEMQKTLDAFFAMSPEDRRACVNSFQKFATMSPAERASFLRNAARWQQMTPQERATWRNLVGKLPPMPPDPVSPPPMPEAALDMEETLATNSP